MISGTRTCALGLLAVAFLVAPSAAATGGRGREGSSPGPAADKASSGGATWEAYQVLMARNMFMRDRASATAANSGRAGQPPAERAVVLRGVSREGEVWFAFLEDAASGTMTKARAGDGAASGKVKAVTLDYIEYEKDGKTVKVEVGRDLEGNAPSVASGSPPGPGEPGAESVIQRLRLRRQREMGGAR